MNRHRSLRFVMLVGAAAGALFAGSCSDHAEEAAPAGGNPTTTTTEAEAAVAGLDFGAGSEADLGEGWTVTPCESGPPLFCVRRKGSSETESVIELMSVPTASYKSVQAALDRGGSAEDALRAQAEEFQQIFERDRPAGCGASYRVDSFGPKPATVAGRAGVSYGFDGHDGARHVERTVQFATIEGQTLHLISTSAIEDGTCMDDGELTEFSVSELTELEPMLVRVIAASRLP